MNRKWIAQRRDANAPAQSCGRRVLGSATSGPSSRLDELRQPQQVTCRSAVGSEATTTGMHALGRAQMPSDEIQASRARILAAADEVRRRLERDLHDGAQQRLVLASISLRRAVEQTRGTPAEPLVTEAQSLLEEGLAELRDLARGIHPAVLSERGLAAALESLIARSPIPVELRPFRERVAPAAEAAIYFTVAEALTNIAKHAKATVARVRVDVHDGMLTAEVADDGVGGADAAAGSGLRGLTDRLDTLGGTLTIESRPGAGTIIHARVPSRTHDSIAR
jgi:signal transduction histidine kinase